MIVYDLECSNGHTFEGWFDSAEAMEEQQNQGLLTCPVCETGQVFRKPSPVAVRTPATSTAYRGHAETVNRQEIDELHKQISRFIENHFENVGPNFAKEALNIHYGVSETRNIRGTTTGEEDELLEKEGVPILKFPMHNDPEEELH